jgi:hypothetical protein
MKPVRGIPKEARTICIMCPRRPTTRVLPKVLQDAMRLPVGGDRHPMTRVFRV